MASSAASTEFRLSLAARRFRFWDDVSRERALHPVESLELERAMRQMRHDEIRAQASPPPQGRQKKAKR